MEKREHLPARIVGRYAVYEPIARGGMASVCFGRQIGPMGFARTVVVKRLHPQFATDPECAAMFLDEARVAARICHPNVVSVIDIVQEGDEILLVMEYVHGESLTWLSRSNQSHDEKYFAIIANVMIGALQGLHAAHETKGENGRPLDVVHRDVSPQNTLVGVDGIPRVVDFGIAKAANQSHASAVGILKGKVRYMSPEQATGAVVDRRTDIWAAGVMLWELLTRKRLFDGETDVIALGQLLKKTVPSPREVASSVPEALASVVLRALARKPENRFPTALAMVEALEAASGLIHARELGAWVSKVAEPRLVARRRLLDDIEAETMGGFRSRTSPPKPLASSTPAGPLASLSPSALSAPAVPRIALATLDPPALNPLKPRKPAWLRGAGMGLMAVVGVAAVVGLHARAVESSRPAASGLNSGVPMEVDAASAVSSNPLAAVDSSDRALAGVASPPTPSGTVQVSTTSPVSASSSSRRVHAMPTSSAAQGGRSPSPGPRDKDFHVPLYGRD